MKRFLFRLQLLICGVLFVIWCSKKFSFNKAQEVYPLKNRLSLIEDIQRRTGDQLNELYRSLEVVEQSEKNNVKNQLAQIKVNLTQISLPGPFDFVSHLKGKSLVPGFHKGNLSPNVEFLIGIPTVKRDVQSYLFDTLRSLFSNVEASDSFSILIYIGESDVSYVQTLANEIIKTFEKEFDAGKIDIISPPTHYYPNFEKDIEELMSGKTFFNTFGDAPDRIKWRQKQNLDYAFLWSWAREKSTYYLQLEDDVVAKPGFLKFIKSKVMNDVGSWFLMEFTNLGFIGKLFRSESLSVLLDYVLMFYREKPVDWLLEHILYTKVCNPEKDMKECAHEKRKIKRKVVPAQFQHVGIHSSLSGKVQKLRDGSFGKKGINPSRNPPLVFHFSSIKPYQKFNLDRYYKGIGNFWGTNPSKGGVIVFVFNEVTIKSIRILSGGKDHPSDFLPSDTQISLANPQSSFSPTETSLLFKNDKFYPIGNVDSKGNFELSFEDKPETCALKITLGSETGYWLWLYDLYIEV